jgi:hypothetical protein
MNKINLLTAIMCFAQSAYQCLTGQTDMGLLFFLVGNLFFAQAIGGVNE